MDICAIYGFCVGGKSFHYSNPSLAPTYIHFYELILLVRLPYVIGELFSKYQPGTKRTCLIIVILRQLHAAKGPFHGIGEVISNQNLGQNVYLLIMQIMFFI